MSLEPEDLDILADCRTEQDASPADVPFLAHDSRGMASVVPPGERWYLAFVEVNSVAGAAATVWIVPANQSVASTTVKWTVIPTITVAAATSETNDRPAYVQPLRVMKPGDSIWVMGGGTAINVYILGWRVQV